ncbi:hypothetical protein [Bacillus cereus]|uniref:hypothetical protein n=1 Tax=Bacillus cereus TaxID=1396 RepID=UPI000BEC69FA|nr:hypothetical protein [Bacillus cereus]PEA01897.1 hypothetical protein CON37_25365 [Bacillus cereus]
MIKNRVRKMVRQTVFGFASLVGIVMTGVNSASAEEHPVLKDSNGNPVEYEQKYYMEPYEFRGYKLEEPIGGGRISNISLAPSINVKQMEFILHLKMRFLMHFLRIKT